MMRYRFAKRGGLESLLRKLCILYGRSTGAG